MLAMRASIVCDELWISRNSRPRADKLGKVQFGRAWLVADKAGDLVLRDIRHCGEHRALKPPGINVVCVEIDLELRPRAEKRPFVGKQGVRANCSAFVGVGPVGHIRAQRRRRHQVMGDDSVIDRLSAALFGEKRLVQRAKHR